MSTELYLLADVLGFDIHQSDGGYKGHRSVVLCDGLFSSECTLSATAIDTAKGCTWARATLRGDLELVACAASPTSKLSQRILVVVCDRSKARQLQAPVPKGSVPVDGIIHYALASGVQFFSRRGTSSAMQYNRISRKEFEGIVNVDSLDNGPRVKGKGRARNRSKTVQSSKPS